MRVSTDPNDPGFGNWATRSCAGFEVWLDGAKQAHAITACEETGTVIRCLLDERGKPIAEGESTKVETVRGVVTIKRVEWPIAVRSPSRRLN